MISVDTKQNSTILPFTLSNHGLKKDCSLMVKFLPNHNLVIFFLAVSVGGYSFNSWVALAWLTLPICFLKQIINVIQMIVASINIARLDESERAL